MGASTLCDAEVILRTIAALLCLIAPRPAAAATASFYGAESGSRTASGERFDPNAMTAAHRTLPFGTWVRVTMNGRTIMVRINDRGPFVKGRDIDLTEAAARRIQCGGVCKVHIEVAEPPYVPRPGDWSKF